VPAAAPLRSPRNADATGATPDTHDAAHIAAAGGRPTADSAAISRDTTGVGAAADAAGGCCGAGTGAVAAAAAGTGAGALTLLLPDDVPGGRTPAVAAVTADSKDMLVPVPGAGAAALPGMYMAPLPGRGGIIPPGSGGMPPGSGGMVPGSDGMGMPPGSGGMGMPPGSGGSMCENGA